MDEPHEGYKLLRGVRIDIKRLLTNFEKTESVRFSTFAEEWQKMKFSLIFRQRKSLTELLEFSEEVIHIAKGYLEPPWNFPIRVGALFLLYGLFFKQPIRGAAKIRFIKDEWKQLIQFVEECKEAKHFDICFVHYKLYVKGAYIFTVVPRATGMERGYRKYEIKRRMRQNTINERILRRSNIIEPELLGELNAMEKLYKEKKSEVLGKRDLEFVDIDFSDTLTTKLNQFYKKINEEYPAEAIEDIVVSTKSDEHGPSCSTSTSGIPERGLTIHERRMKRLRAAALKKKAQSETTDEQQVEQQDERVPQVPLDLPEIL